MYPQVHLYTDYSQKQVKNVYSFRKSLSDKFKRKVLVEHLQIY